MASKADTNPWGLDARDFPRHGSDHDKLRFALRYAILAPSAHNTQPWRFRVHDGAVEVLADRLRTLPIVDPSGRELAISCGAALFFLGIALRRFGYAAEISILAGSGDPALLARVRLGERAEPTPGEVVLAHAITHRHTNRQPFHDRPVPADLTAALARAALTEGAWLEPVSDRERKRSLAALVAQAHAEQCADEAFVGELASWIRDPAAGDGMPGHGVPLALADPAQAGAFTRTFEFAARAAESEQDLAAGSPLLAVLGTEADEEADWVRCGEALGHVLLLACAEGLSASFLNQPVEVARHRPHVCEAIGREGFAHVLLRLGYASPATPSPRRPFEDVLER